MLVMLRALTPRRFTTLPDTCLAFLAWLSFGLSEASLTAVHGVARTVLSRTIVVTRATTVFMSPCALRAAGRAMQRPRRWLSTEAQVVPCRVGKCMGLLVGPRPLTLEEIHETVNIFPGFPSTISPGRIEDSR
jgi:hypothetical protein